MASSNSTAKLWHVLLIVGVVGGLLYVVHMVKSHKGESIIPSLGKGK